MAKIEEEIIANVSRRLEPRGNINIPKYEIWEDFGKSSSSGLLTDIDKGIERQSSTMFNTSCLFKYAEGITNKWDQLTFKIWKIKSK